MAIGDAAHTIADNAIGQDATDASDREATAAASAAARQHLDAIRDEWLAPLVEQIRELSFENGRLTAELDAEAKASAEEEIHLLAAEQMAAGEQRRRVDEAEQADQLVNLLEERIRELERRNDDDR